MARVNLADERHGTVWACQTATFDEGEGREWDSFATHAAFATRTEAMTWASRLANDYAGVLRLLLAVDGSDGVSVDVQPRVYHRCWSTSSTGSTSMTTVTLPSRDGIGVMSTTSSPSARWRICSHVPLPLSMWLTFLRGSTTSRTGAPLMVNLPTKGRFFVNRTGPALRSSGNNVRRQS